jgi:hypothetical protein
MPPKLSSPNARTETSPQTPSRNTERLSTSSTPIASTADASISTNSRSPVPKSPFTDEELERLFAACDKIGPQLKQGPGYRTWGGEDVKDFIYLSIYTGLRISDAATFDVTKRLMGNDVFLRMHKTAAVYMDTGLTCRAPSRAAENAWLDGVCRRRHP